MARIVYVAFPTGAISGGQKVILRHVEALNRLGFEAVWWLNRNGKQPTWLEFDVPMEIGAPFRPDDIIVVPSDAPDAIRWFTRRRYRTVILEQNQFAFMNLSLDALDPLYPESFPTILAVGETNANTVRSLYPKAQVEILPCFADERLFKPGSARSAQVAFAPRKRQVEAKIIRSFLQRAHPRHASLPWFEIADASETAAAEALSGSTLFLSLARFESVGMTTLEAMACGCVCAGFTGIGGRQYATPENGFWAPEDDCEAAANGLAEAADLIATGGPELERLRQAAQATAAQWSYARFLTSLEETWERLAPQARTRSTNT